MTESWLSLQVLKFIIFPLCHDFLLWFPWDLDRVFRTLLLWFCRKSTYSTQLIREESLIPISLISYNRLADSVLSLHPTLGSLTDHPTASRRTHATWKWKQIHIKLNEYFLIVYVGQGQKGKDAKVAMASLNGGVEIYPLSSHSTHYYAASTLYRAPRQHYFLLSTALE